MTLWSENDARNAGGLQKASSAPIEGASALKSRIELGYVLRSIPGT